MPFDEEQRIQDRFRGGTAVYAYAAHAISSGPSFGHWAPVTTRYNYVVYGPRHAQPRNARGVTEYLPTFSLDGQQPLFFQDEAIAADFVALLNLARASRVMSPTPASPPRKRKSPEEARELIRGMRRVELALDEPPPTSTRPKRARKPTASARQPKTQTPTSQRPNLADPPSS